MFSGGNSQGTQMHGLHVDTDRLLPLSQQVPREQRYCVFALMIQQRMIIILCLTPHDPKGKARFCKECFEHWNTLVAAQSGHIL